MASLSLSDLLIILTYFGAVFFIGIRFGGKNENIEGYVVGGRRVPWLAVMGSLIATEISAATFLSSPGIGYAEDLGYMQMKIGSFLARFVIAFLFLSAFYKLRYLSVYQYLSTRFGGTSHYTAACFFLMSRVMASAVRLMIASTGLHVILGLPFGWTMIGFALLCLVYTGVGGIKAVIWTDCLQAAVFLTAGVVMLFVLHGLVGWGNILQIGGDAGHLKIFQWAPEDGILMDSNWVMLALVFGFINNLAMMGTDQDLTQRMLSCKNVKQARRSAILGGVVSLPIALMFLMIGVGLFAYYHQLPDASLPTKSIEGTATVDSDKVFPHFIAMVLPAGLRGLLVCGVLAAAMSSLDSAMAALSSSIVVDLYKPFIKDPDNSRQQVWVARLFMILVTVALVSVAWALQGRGQFIWLAFKVGGITYSGLLGVFLVGLLSQRGSDRWNLFAMIGGSLCTATLMLLSETGLIQLAWQYPMLIGVGITFLLGLIPPASETSQN